MRARAAISAAIGGIRRGFDLGLVGKIDKIRLIASSRTSSIFRSNPTSRMVGLTGQAMRRARCDGHDPFEGRDGGRRGHSCPARPMSVETDPSQREVVRHRPAAARAVDRRRYPKPSQGRRGATRSTSNSSSHGDLSQGRLAMRLTLRRNRWTRAAVLAAWIALLRLPEASLHRPIQASPP